MIGILDPLMLNPLVMGATCPLCGSTNTQRLEVTDNGRVVRVYFECNDCGNVW